MREFLETYSQSINLDCKSYDKYFPERKGRADFIFFNSQVICEYKEIQNIQIPNKVEKLSKKEGLSKQNLKRDLYNSIEIALSKANKQIKDTKEALDLPNALGLIILENRIASDLSVLALIDAVNRKTMIPGGLVHTDCVLCLDLINTFSKPGGKPVRPGQIIWRDTATEEKSGTFIIQLMEEFCKYSGTPLFEGWDIKKGSQTWFTDTSGKYKSYTAKVDFEESAEKEKYKQIQILGEFLNRWWWVISLLFIFYDWFIR
jgi:hypothetical protein